MEKIDKDTLKKKLDRNENVTVIEVLDDISYKKEHIKGAINIPVEKIGTIAKKKFDKDDELIVYCTSKDCSASPTAAKKLESLGFKNVYDFEGGKKAWREAGYPMETQ